MATPALYHSLSFILSLLLNYCECPANLLQAWKNYDMMLPSTKKKKCPQQADTTEHSTSVCTSHGHLWAEYQIVTKQQT